MAFGQTFSPSEQELVKDRSSYFWVSIQEYINFWISFDDIGPVVTKHLSVYKSFLALLSPNTEQ